jgi:hypothetical protein
LIGKSEKSARDGARANGQARSLTRQSLRHESQGRGFGSFAAGAAIVIVAAVAGGIVAGPALLSLSGGNAPQLSSTGVCPVTKPDDSFVPPSPYPSKPTPGNQKVWYGTDRLWTMLNRDGETWGRLINEPHTITVKSFWWSTSWSMDSEPKPNISVVGERLDGAGAFTAGSPGTNASAEFGAAMLVGFDVPTAGCWRITATFRGASLSYVVRAVDQ